MTELREELLVSGGGAVRAFALDGTWREHYIPLEKAGAISTANGEAFCASGDRIVRLDAQSMLPKAILGGGPDMVDIKTSADGAYLYALCGEADSVLMLNLRRCEPVLLNRAGVNPKRMAIDGDMLAVAGGESGAVHLLCAKTLCMLGELAMPGPAYDVTTGGGRLCALCLTASLDSALVTVLGGRRSVLKLSGMPGCLLMQGGLTMAATEGMLYSVSQDGTRVVGMHAAPGRASWLGMARGRLLLLDAYSESLFCQEGEMWRLVCREAAHAVLSSA